VGLESTQQQSHRCPKTNDNNTVSFTPGGPLICKLSVLQSNEQRQQQAYLLFASKIRKQKAIQAGIYNWKPVSDGLDIFSVPDYSRLG